MRVVRDGGLEAGSRAAACGKGKVLVAAVKLPARQLREQKGPQRKISVWWGRGKWRLLSS